MRTPVTGLTRDLAPHARPCLRRYRQSPETARQW